MNRAARQPDSKPAAGQRNARSGRRKRATGENAAMRLVIGGSWQGKREHVKRKYGLADAEILQVTAQTLPEVLPSIGSLHNMENGGQNISLHNSTMSDTENPCGGIRCVSGLHHYIRHLMASVQNAEEPAVPILEHIRAFSRRCPDIILICDEVGGGIVPVERAERDYRECVGRVLCGLAEEAESVERVYCGIAQTIKRTVYVALIRHGATESNRYRRYLGLTDESLSGEGIDALQARLAAGLYPPASRVLTSPLGRCRQTARILYPDIAEEVVPELRETDFGLFEGKNYGELEADEKLRDSYRAWVDSGGSLPFPEGESLAQSTERCSRAFLRLLPEMEGTTALIVHGGTIMGILSACAEPRRAYYDYWRENGAGYLCRVELTGDGGLYRMKIERELA